MWDLKAKLLHLPLVALLGQMRDAAPVYASGGFTTYDDRQLRDQLAGWVHNDIPRVKMKIGARPEDDLRRVAVARDSVGMHSELFVDADGAYGHKQALAYAQRFAGEYNVTWFEEPVSPEDLPGLQMLRDKAPAGMEIAAGESGFTTVALQHLLEARAVDVLQADATRCGGITGFMDVAALADAHLLPLSSNGAPSLHMHLACAARSLRHVEYFHDHARMEQMLFDGFREPAEGAMHPDLSLPGLGLAFKEADAVEFREDI